MAPDGTDRGAAIVWRAPLFLPSGYGEEARAFVLGLQALGLPIAARSLGRFSPGFRRQLDPHAGRTLDALTARPVAPDHVSVIHFPPQIFSRLPGAALHVGRTMCETDGLPADWVGQCNLMDEVWVPSEFNMQTFARAGVRVPLRKVPEGVDTARFSPEVPPLVLAGTRRTIFLSMFEWTWRKGWDLLLRAWTQAFHRDDDVCLILRTRPMDDLEGDSTARIESAIDGFLARELRIPRAEVAPIVVMARPLTDADVPRLIAAAAALVAPSRGEGWGRPHIEAMACAKPVIATRWSGNLEFMDDSNSLLVDVEGMEAVDHRHEVPYHHAQRWAIPSLPHLVERLRTIVRDPEGSAARGRKARRDVVERWGWEAACRVAAERLSDLGVGRGPLGPRRPAPRVVVWSDAGDQVFSLAKIDREIGSRLTRDCRLAVVRRDEAPPALSADVQVGHAWPPEISPPANGHWVVILHWDYGTLPAAWVDAWKDRVDEIWVPSQHVRDACLRSGLPPERVVVTANGIDPQRFRPEVEPLPLATRKRFRFLYVGTAAWRKGLDILVNAYLREFRAGDDVCLVAKVQAPGDAPEERAAWESIRRCQAVPGGPEIELIDRTLTEDDMPRLYAACDCLVHPYRAEGFGIPLAEAMACGLPVIATGSGPALEVCEPDVASFIPARVVSRGEHRIGEWDTIGDPHRAEPDPQALRRLMRRAVDDATEAKSRARRAAQKTRARLDWDRTAHVVADRILRLSDQPIRRFTAAARLAIPPGRERVHHALRWGETVLRLETPDAELAGVVADLAGLECEPMGEAPGPHVAVREADAGFVVSASSRSIWCASRDDVVLALVGALSDGFAALADRQLLVHAGAIVAEGRAALFVGPERAGKSWLAFAAWLDGFTVIGDDMIALHPGGTSASAFPRPFKLRVAEPRLPQELAGRGIKDGVALGRVDGEWRVAIGRRLPGIAHHATSYPVSHLFFLSRRDAGPSTTAALADPREAVALLTAATAIGGAAPDLRVVALLRALWDGGGVERLEVGPDDAPGALALLRERLARAR